MYECDNIKYSLIWLVYNGVLQKGISYQLWVVGAFFCFDEILV